MFDQHNDDIRTMSLEDIRALIREADARDYAAMAVELLRLYLELDPDNSRFQYMYADNLRSLGRLGDAYVVLASLEFAKVPEEQQYLVELSRAQIHDDRGEWKEAEERYVAATRRRPASTVPWVYYGAFLSRQGRVDDAIAVFTQGLTAEGDLDEVHFNLGNCARAQARYETAKNHYELALHIAPGDENYRLALDDVNSAIEVR